MPSSLHPSFFINDDESSLRLFETAHVNRMPYLSVIRFMHERIMIARALSQFFPCRDRQCWEWPPGQRHLHVDRPLWYLIRRRPYRVFLSLCFTISNILFSNECFCRETRFALENFFSLPIASAYGPINVRKVSFASSDTVTRTPFDFFFTCKKPPLHLDTARFSCA